MLSPHLSVCKSTAPDNSHLITLTKDEYVGVGPYSLLRRGVIRLSNSEYHLLKAAFGVIDATILEQEWHFNQMERRERLNLNR